MKKNASIVGITGRVGACLAELLPEENGEAHGIERCTSSFDTDSSNLIGIIELAELAAVELP